MERKEYRLSKDARLNEKVALGVVFGLVLLFGLVVLWQEDLTLDDLLLWGGMVLMLMIAGLTGFFFRIKHEHRAIAVDAEGIESLEPTKPGGRLRWAEIGAISSHPFFLCIQLHRADGQPPFLLFRELAGVGEVLQLLLHKVPLAAAPSSFPVLFRKTLPRPVLAILVLSLIFASVFGYLGGAGRLFAVLGAVGVGSLHFFCAMGAYRSDDRLRVVVTPTEFQFYRRRHVSTIAFSTVTAVELRPTSDLSQAVYKPAVVIDFSYTVVVRLSDGETLDVCPFGCDPFAVYCAVRTGWEQHQQDALSTYGRGA